MKRSTRGLVVCLFAAMTQGALAQSTKAAAAPTKPPSRTFTASVFMGPAVDCAADSSTCNVAITMSQGVVNGVNLCLARLPGEIRVAGTGTNATVKAIAWTLEPAAMTGVTFSFQAKHGILVLADVNGQLQPGAIGTSPAQFVVKNKRKKRGDSTYLPIILQTDTATGLVTLCAAADPKIVNN
jgi:hypothetical protein